ncbi:MAG: hypothetical protein RL227_1413 [Pseudomonadota bacterium]|jgi:hypothetical protein
MNALCNPALVRAQLSYDPATGVFVWLPRSRDDFKSEGAFRAWMTTWCGKPAGGSRGNGIVILLCGRHYRAHRLAWAWMTGEWPLGQIDHINGDPFDNRWSNLRDVSHSVNQQNQRRAHSNNKTGLLGVSKHPRLELYLARIQASGKTVRLGYFKRADDAHAAYVEAKRKLHEGCTL